MAAFTHYAGFKRLVNLRGELLDDTPWKHLVKTMVESSISYMTLLVSPQRLFLSSCSLVDPQSSLNAFSPKADGNCFDQSLQSFPMRAISLYESLRYDLR